MKKIIFFLVICCIFLVSNAAHAYDLTKRHDIFTPAFQLIWQDFKELISTKKINFKGIDPSVAWVLNSNRFTTDDISLDSYYKIAQPISLSLKAKIQREIFEKFGETSQILDNIDWNTKGNNDILLYALFKKDVKFPKEFYILSSKQFNNSKDEYKFFGFNKENAKEFTSQVKPLFYAYDWDYAISIDTQSGDRIVLYRTDSKQNVYDLYSQIDKKAVNNIKLSDNDELIIPFISIDKQIEYKELQNRKINNTKFIIAKTIDDIKFNLDNKGAKLRNESALEAVEMSLRFPDKVRIFDFSKPFVLYMIEKDKSLPYFALRINNTDFLVK